MRTEFNYHFINVEGGPIVFGGADSLESWNGIEGDNYSSLTQRFDESECDLFLNLLFNRNLVSAWEVNGPGVVYILSSRNRIQLARHWFAQNSDHAKAISDVFLAEHRSASNQSNAEIHLNDTLVVAWAPECLNGIPSSVSSVLAPDLDLAIEQSVLLLPVETGKYLVETDRFSNDSGAAIRLNLNRI